MRFAAGEGKHMFNKRLTPAHGRESRSMMSSENRFTLFGIMLKLPKMRTKKEPRIRRLSGV